MRKAEGVLSRGRAGVGVGVGARFLPGGSGVSKEELSPHTCWQLWEGQRRGQAGSHSPAHGD